MFLLKRDRCFFYYDRKSNKVLHKSKSTGEWMKVTGRWDPVRRWVDSDRRWADPAMATDRSRDCGPSAADAWARCTRVRGSANRLPSCSRGNPDARAHCTVV